MAEIVQLHTVERRLYGMDAIPWPYLTLQTHMQALRERYKFQQVAQQPEAPGVPPQIVAAVGEFKAGERLEAVEQLVIQQNLAQAQISASSQFTDLFYDDLDSFFESIGSSQAALREQEKTRTYQTIAIARLNFAPVALLSDALRRFLAERAMPAFRSTTNGAAELHLEHLAWSVQYTTKDVDFVYVPKTVTIEPRLGTRLEEQIYYTQSPTDSDTHVKLLNDLEEMLSAASVAGTAGRKNTRRNRRVLKNVSRP